jgi:putative membrane protein
LDVEAAYLGGMPLSAGSMGGMHPHLHGPARMMMGPEPRMSVHELLTGWQLTPFPMAVLVVLAGIAFWYLRSTRQLGARGRHWSRWRSVSFLAGLAAVAVALASSVDLYTNYTFTAHIIQHLLLMIVAPPLAALGAPMTLLLQTSSRGFKRRVLAVLHSRAFGVISHPLPVFFYYYLSMYLFFLTPAVGFAMEHMWLMDLINLGFLGGATLFWWPMVGIDPIPGGRMSPAFKIINLLIGIPAEAFLGIALLMATTPAGPMYTLTTTHVGGGVLWAAGELATLIGLVPIYIEWTRSDARAARRIDAKLAAGEPLVAPPVEGQGMAATLRSLRRG